MLKIGIVGCGYMGVMHLNSYLHIDGVEVTAVSGVVSDAAKAAVAQTNAVVYEDAKEMIENADLDVIDICLPTFLHAEYGLLAMEHAKYVFIEKPVALTIEECEALIAKSRETGCRVQVGQVIRFWIEYVYLREAVQSGRYGAVVNANFRRISSRPDWGHNNWLRNPTLSGGCGQDLHIHDVDFILSLFGEPKSFYTVTNTVGEPNSYINTLMQYDAFVVSAEGTWDLPASHPFEASYRVAFERAALEYVGNKITVYDENGAHEIAIEKPEITGNAYAKGSASGNITDLGGYYNELAYFCERAKNGEEIGEARLVDAVASLRFLMKEISFGK